MRTQPVAESYKGLFNKFCDFFVPVIGCSNNEELVLLIEGLA
jgi:hypothetical protein